MHLCTGGRARDGSLFSQVAKGTHLPVRLAAPPKRPKKSKLTIVRIDDSDRSTNLEHMVTLNNSHNIEFECHNVDKMTDATIEFTFPRVTQE